MATEITDMRYAHCEGHTDLCYDDTGRYLFTCGSDGDMRVWDGFEDDDPVTHHIGEYSHAIAFKNGRLFVATDVNSIQAYTFPDINPDGIVTRFTSTVNSMCCSDDGKVLLAGASDFTIKTVDTTNSTQNIFEGHQAPILSVALDPQSCYMASSSCDGTVCIWRICDQVQLKVMNLIPKTNDFCLSKTLCHLSWYPKNGKYLAVPVNKEIHLYQRETWNCATVLKDNADEVMSIAVFSPCGNYLAATSIDGYVYIWETNSFSCVHYFKHEKSLTICSLVWNPSDKKELALCDNQGQLGLIENIGKLVNKKEDSAISSRSKLPADREDDFANSPEHESNDDSEDEMTISRKHKKSKALEENEFEIDIGAIKASLEPKIFGTQEIGEEAKKVTTPTPAPLPIPSGPPPTPLQQPFQPASTPIHWEHRFMVWNSVGVVRSYNTEEENSIDIEFHDTTIHHAMHLTNTLNHTMASLSAEALLLACPKEESTASQAVCIHFDTWDSNKEWSVEMPEGEDIEAIAVGSSWVAIATNTCFVRLFTIGGVQLEVFSIPGPVVCMAAQEKTLTIVFHQGSGIPGNQNLAMMVVKMKNRKHSLINPIYVPLNPKSFLSWLGFTDEGTVCTVDSAGVIRILNENRWFPIANTKDHTKGKSDHYFVVGVSEMQQQIRCIPCKGSRYPPTLPRPAVTVLPFQLPLCELQTDKGRYEEEHWRVHHLHTLLRSLSKEGFDVDTELENADRKRTDGLLRMFALATRADREFRALEVAELMPSYRVVQGAIRYATQRHHLALAERLGQVAQEKLQEEMEINNENEEITEETSYQEISNLKTLHNKKLSHSTDDDLILQPKTLLLPKLSRSDPNDSDNIVDNQDITDQDTKDDKEEQKYFPASSDSGQKNPFKVQVQKRSTSIGIDGILENGVKKLITKPVDDTMQKKSKISKQLKLFAPKENIQTNDVKPMKNKTSGFKSYLEENRPILSKENPNLDEAELIKLAIQKFKQLSPDEKKKWTASTMTDMTKKRKNYNNNDENLTDEKRKKCISMMEEKEM